MKYWQSIDELPIYYYYRVLETGDLKYLAYDLPSNVNQDYMTAKLKEAWDKIQMEFFDLMAKDKDYVEALKKDVRFQIKKVKAQISSLAYDKIIFEGIKKTKESENVEFDYFQSISILEEKLKFAIDDRTMTVRRYFSHFKRLKNGK